MKGDERDIKSKLCTLALCWENNVSLGDLLSSQQLLAF